MEKISKFYFCISLVILPFFACAETTEEYKKVDKILNETYSLFLKSAGSENSQSIKSTQLSWIRFKKKHCNEDYDTISERSVAPPNIISCLIAETEERTNEMKRIMLLKENPLEYHKDKLVKMFSILESGGYDISEVISKLRNKAAEYGDPASSDWKEYIQKNCTYSSKYSNDKRDICEGRLIYMYLLNYQ